MKAKSIDTSLKLKQEQLYVAKYVIVVPKLKSLFEMKSNVIKNYHIITQNYRRDIFA